VVENVKKVRAVTFRSTTVVGLPQQKEHVTTTQVLIVEPSRMRQVYADGTIAIFDLREKKVLGLDPNKKEAIVMEMESVSPSQLQLNMLEVFKKVDASAAKPLGEKVIGGKAAQGFLAANSRQDITIWVDKQTRLPVAAEIIMHSGFMEPVPTTMTDFVWDPPVNEADFSLTPPDGYTMRSLKLNMAPEAEVDVINALRFIAELNGNRFPTEFNMAGFGAVIKDLSEHGPKRGTPEHDKLQEKILPGMLQVGRGFVFAGNSEYGSDWHYAGKDVALGQKDRAVVWYLPKGGEKYRVIYGDLRIEEVEKSKLPDVPSTILGPMNPAAPQK